MAPRQVQREAAMRAIIIDSQPLVVIGILRMLEHLPGLGPIHGRPPTRGIEGAADDRRTGAGGVRHVERGQ